MLFTEGKHFSNRVEVAMMARKLAAFEHDMAYRGQDEVSHMELHDIWTMIETLDGAIPLSQRPNQVQILTSLADQRKPIQGVVSKDSLDCRIAAVSCQNLEKLYLGQNVQEKGHYIDKQEVLKVFINKAAQIVADF